MANGPARFPRVAGPADTSAVRSHNLALVLSDVRDHQPTSRSAIAGRTGLARGSLTSLVPELIAAGLLREQPASSRGHVGRPMAAVELDGRSLGLIVAEIGVSDVHVESVDLGGRVLGDASVPHGRPLGQPEVIADLAARLVDAHLRMLAEASIRCVRIVLVMAAPLIGSEPIVMTSVDLGWDDVDFAALLRERIGRSEAQIVLVNDADMAAIAEHEWLAKAAGRAVHLVYLKSDTGVGGSVLVAGRPFVGAHGTGFEPGHVVAVPGGESCTCGRRGCVAAEIGPDRVTEEAGLGDLASATSLATATAELVARAHRGDPIVLAALTRVGQVLERFIADVAVLYDPDQILIGGYWADVFPYLGLRGDDGAHPIDALARARERAPAGRFVSAGRLGGRAARIGAARHEADLLFADPGQLTQRVQDLN